MQRCCRLAMDAEMKNVYNLCICKISIKFTDDFCGNNELQSSLLMIAHRLSTLRKANKIIVVDKGEILEMGTPEELMALKGKCYTQAGSFFRIIIWHGYAPYERAGGGQGGRCNHLCLGCRAYGKNLRSRNGTAAISRQFRFLSFPDES